MSADGRPFDALGRILSEGGDIALANAIARDNLKQEVILITRWREWGASDSDISTVRNIATEAVRAGRYMTDLDPNDPVNFSMVPVNPLLFGDDQEGLRFYASTDFKLSSTGLWYRGDFKLPDIFTPNDIITQMEGQAAVMIGNYPQKFMTKDGSDVQMSEYIIQVVIGRF